MIELYIQRQRVDLAPDTVIAQTFQVLPIGDLSKRTSDFTNSFTIPGTANNQQIFELFGSPYIHSDRTNEAKKNDGRGVTRRWLRADINIGGIPLMRNGKVVLHYVEYDDLGTPNYHIGIVAQGIQQIYEILRDKTLQNLDLKEYNHYLNPDTYNTSQKNTQGYTYPYAEYTKGVIEQVSNPLEKSYSLEQRINSLLGKTKIEDHSEGSINIERQLPAFFVHTLLHKTFDLIEREGKVKIKDRSWLSDDRLKTEVLPATNHPQGAYKEDKYLPISAVYPYYLKRAAETVNGFEDNILAQSNDPSNIQPSQTDHIAVYRKKYKSPHLEEKDIDIVTKSDTPFDLIYSKQNQLGIDCYAVEYKGPQSPVIIYFDIEETKEVKLAEFNNTTVSLYLGNHRITAHKIQIEPHSKEKKQSFGPLKGLLPKSNSDRLMIHITNDSGKILFHYRTKSIEESDELPLSGYVRCTLYRIEHADNNGIFIDAAHVLPPINLYDFLTDAMKRYGIIAQDKVQTLSFAYIRDLLAQRQNTQDWSHEFVRLKKLEPRLDDSYATTNTLAFKEPSEKTKPDEFPSEKDNYLYTHLAITQDEITTPATKSTIHIDNTTLKETPNALFESIFTRYPTLTITRYTASLSAQKEPLFQPNELNKIVYYPVINPAEQGNYQGDYGLFRIVEHDQQPGLIYQSETFIVDNTRYKLAPLNMQDYRDAYYTEFGALLQRQEKYTAVFNINVSHIHQVDLLRPVWCRPLNGYFMISKIHQFIPGRLTEVELIRLPHASDVEKYKESPDTQKS